MNSAHHFSRRQLLRTLGPAGALMLHPRCRRAAAAPRSEISFVVVADTHLGHKEQDAAERIWLQTAAEIGRAPGAF